MPEEAFLPKRRFRFRWWMLPIILIAGIWGGSWGWDYYKLFSGQTPMFDVAIKLQVGDEIVEIERTVPCFEKSQGESFQYIFKQRPFTYRARDLSTGAHLKDGRAVMSIIPKVCKEISDAMEAGLTGNIVPNDFLPMTALIDDFDDPQLMKVFGARSYYARDDAEVKVYPIRLNRQRPDHCQVWRMSLAGSVAGIWPRALKEGCISKVRN